VRNGGIPFPSRLADLRECRELPSRVRGGAPVKNETGAILSVTEHFCLQDIVNHENRVNVDTNKKLVTIACYDMQHVCAYLQPFSRYTR